MNIAQLISKSRLFLMLKFYSFFYYLHKQMNIHPARKSVIRMVQCEGIVSLAMPNWRCRVSFFFEFSGHWHYISASSPFHTDLVIQTTAIAGDAGWAQ